MVADTTLWEDLLVRSTTTDTGQVPFQGALSSSPDLIPAGISPVDSSKFLNDMTKDYGVDLVVGSNNYFYARGINTAAANKAGTFYLYYSGAGLLLYPSQWVPITLEDGTSGAPVSANANGKFVTASGFLWPKVPPPINPPSDHYCLIGRLDTQDHPNPMPTILQIQDFASFVANNRGMSWRNLAMITDPNPPQLQYTIAYSQGTVAHEVYVTLTAQNVPNGCQIAFECGTAGPEPLLVLEQTTVNNPSFVAGVYSQIPANFSSSITYQLWTNGKTLPPNASLTLNAIYVQNPGDPELRGGVHLGDLIPEELMAPEHLERAQIGPVAATTLGQHSAVANFSPEGVPRARGRGDA